MDMNISIDNSSNKNLPLSKESDTYLKNLIHGSSSSIISNRSSNSKNKIKKSIIDNLNTNEPLITNQNNNSNENIRNNSITMNKSNSNSNNGMNNENSRNNSITGSKNNINNNKISNENSRNSSITGSKNNINNNKISNENSRNNSVTMSKNNINNNRISNENSRNNSVTMSKSNISNNRINNENSRNNSIAMNKSNSTNNEIYNENNQTNSKSNVNNRFTSNNSSRKGSSASSKTPTKMFSNNSIETSRKSSIDRLIRNSSSFNKYDDTNNERDNELIKIRELKSDIDKIIEQKRRMSESSKNSMISNSISKDSLTRDMLSTQQSSENTSQILFSSKNSINSKPPLSSSKNDINNMNLMSQEFLEQNSSQSSFNNKPKNLLNDHNNGITINLTNLSNNNLYLPKDNNRLKSKEDLAKQDEKVSDEFGLFSPTDDKEYNYLFDLIDNEYSVDDEVEPVNVLESGTSINSSEKNNNEKILTKDPSIIYNDDNKEKLERCYSSSFELSGVWKHFIVPYTTGSSKSNNNPKKDCVSRVYDDYTTESKKKAYHHWIKIMLPEYSTFISCHSLQTICAQNYIIAALIEKMSFFKMAEEDPNPVIRESPQYNVERLDICLNYIKNVMNIPIAVTAYDLHLGKLGSIFSLLMQLIRYYKKGKEMKSQIDQENNSMSTNDVYEEANNDSYNHYKILLNEDENENEQNNLLYSKEMNLAQ
ncbi:hypothetical protein BCR32DRAFT_231739 [Anaeromyces robustus]|uniref:Uncharacterized protein n=1 Tax=Anaeromyces robustus TaxID=1754192 RepID=A0A1Y1XAG7_9FUNG|nr:hypothetical protein BCR32DRAFT_231739 [Anaeromyces robustus]|eukprot:ORX82730.1 hypothetical protein BCR32DRAFT_231739 [Anaeromyces robustus]